MLPSYSGGQLCDLILAPLWRWLIAVFVYLEFSTGVLFLCPILFHWVRFSVPPAPSTVCVLLEFTVYFSVLRSSSALDAALWLGR
jgi:hypothetical protein